MTARRPQVALRPETDADRALSKAIYASTREAELALVPWTDAQREAFIEQQFDAQFRHYRAHYVGVEWMIVVVDGIDAGRIYLGEADGMLLLVDLALLPAFRGRGVGGALMDDVLARAAAKGLPVRLHVEKDNPALAWYRRLGFEVDGDAGFYWRMLRPPQASEAAA